MVSFFAFDYDNFNRAWSGGDGIRFTFDRVILQGRQRISGGKSYVDSLFGFSHRLGDSYSGSWTDDSIFVVTALDTQIA